MIVWEDEGRGKSRGKEDCQLVLELDTGNIQEENARSGVQVSGEYGGLQISC